MTLCAACRNYVHEECVGFTKKDKEVFTCSTFEVKENKNMCYRKEFKIA